MHPPPHPKTMTIVSAEDNFYSFWASELTIFRHKTLTKMEWTEGVSIRNLRQGMTINPRAYQRSDNLGFGDITNMPGNLGWSETNENLTASLKCWGGNIKGVKWGWAVNTVILPPTPLPYWLPPSTLDCNGFGGGRGGRVKKERKRGGGRGIR